MSLSATVHEGSLEQLTPEWVELLERDDRATPFSRPEWIGAYWRHLAPATATPWTVLVRQEGRLLGLAQLDLRRRGPVRVLRVPGEQVSDFWDVVADGERRAEVVGAVAAALRAAAGGWDAFVLRRLSGDSPTAGAVAASGLSVRLRGMEPCPAVALPSSFDDFLARLPTKRRTDVRRHLRRLDDGELRLCPVTADTEIPAAIERWRRLRERQWAAMERDLDPLHATAPFGAFVVDAVRGLMAAGHAVVWEFRRDGEDEVVGSVINLVDDRTVYGWLGGYAPSAARLGVGKIAIAEGIRSSIAAGRTEFSLLLGPEPYKYFWHPVDGQSPDFLVHSRRPRSLLALGAARVGGRLA